MQTTNEKKKRSLKKDLYEIRDGVCYRLCTSCDSKKPVGDFNSHTFRSNEYVCKECQNSRKKAKNGGSKPRKPRADKGFGLTPDMVNKIKAFNNNACVITGATESGRCPLEICKVPNVPETAKVWERFAPVIRPIAKEAKFSLPQGYVEAWRQKTLNAAKPVETDEDSRSVVSINL